MSLHSYLNKNYGSGNKDKERQDKKSAKRSTRSPSALIISETTQETFVDNLPKSIRKTQVRNRETKSLWKNLETNEIQKHDDFTSSKGSSKISEGSQQITQLSSGAHAGLQTAEQVARQLKAKEMDEQEKSKMTKLNTQTVFRDEKGRKINDIEEVLRREQINSDQQEAIRLKTLRDFNMGEVQKKMRDEGLTLNQVIGSNNFMKNDLKFADPAEDFDYIKQSKKSTASSPMGRKLYEKVSSENRFSITPGYRWDGVDRSNGFEKKWFAKSNEIQEEKVQKYTMQEDL